MLLTTFLIGACFSHLCFPPEIAYTNIDVCIICAAAKISISDAKTVSMSILDLFKYWLIDRLPLKSMMKIDQHCETYRLLSKHAV